MKVSNIVFLLPTFASYRIPVLEKISQEFPKFTVLTLEEKALYLESERIALRSGSFHRKIMKGKQIFYGGNYNQGLGSQSRILFTPGLSLSLMSLKPDIVISEAFSVWTMTSIMMGYPTILFWEGGNSYTERNLKPWKRHIRKWMTTRIKAFITNGQLSKNYLVEEMGANENKVFAGAMCPTPVPDRLSPLRIKEFTNLDKVSFLFSGQLVERKGLHHLLHATAILNREKLPRDFEILILGDGSQRAECEQLSEKLDIRQKVNFIGFVSPDEIWEYYAKAHVFVLPTLHDNWPLVLPEAMSMGLPVIVSNFAGNVPDLLQEGKNGFVFNPQDHNQLATLMKTYIENVSLINTHGKQSIHLSSQYNPVNAVSIFNKAITLAANE